MKNNAPQTLLGRGQQGAVLIIGLIMMLLMTIVGLSAIRGSNMQEMMAGNMKDHQISFQATESGLRIAEATANVLLDTSGVTKGLIPEQISGGLLSYWQAYKWSGSVPESIDTGLELDTKEKPRYVIEALDVAAVRGANGSCVQLSTCAQQKVVVYRITSRGVGMAAESNSFLQAIYLKP